MANITINDTVVTRSQIFYLDYDKGNDLNDGSNKNPLKNFSTALSKVTTDAIIYFKKGTHHLSPISCNDAYSSAGIFDNNKCLFICGEGKDSICKYEPSKYTGLNRDKNMVIFLNSLSTIVRLTLEQHLVTDTTHCNAFNQNGLGTLQNVFIHQISPSPSYPHSIVYDNGVKGKLKFVNCVFKFEGSKTYSNYSGSFLAINSLMNIEIYKNKTNVVREVTTVDLESTAMDLINIGKDDLGKSINAGVYGNIFAWNFFKYCALHKGEYRVVDSYDIISIIPEEKLNDLQFIKNNFIDDMNPLLILSDGFKILLLK